ncbi:hypothetical protein [Erwinia piriflorinigrans]|uniref:hypothetical protein n=1 Tax=Erwinia piriflorinigrans TaxID=665097 RepID=UPI0012ED4A20|nr:hypothetical protein [Erwinia piriflorinigrans]
MRFFATMKFNVQRIVGALYTTKSTLKPTVVAFAVRRFVPGSSEIKLQLAASWWAATIALLSLLLSKMTTNADQMNGNFNKNP